ncbi:MAG: PucR family transcriptional regulator [Clostridia bacterium]|nr:PucR family transcriptional regulator [Clostridia bacterium]
MKVTVADCAQLDVLQSAKLLTYNSNMGNRVTSVSVLDAMSVEDALTYHGIRGQLLLTSFAGITNNGYMQSQIVEALAKVGVAGIIVFQNQGEKLVQKQTLEVATRLDFPILEITASRKINYSTAIKAIEDRILYGNTYTNNLISKTIYHLLNTEKYTNFQAAMREAAIINNIQLVLFTPDYQPVFSIETRQAVSIADAVKVAKNSKVEKSRLYQFLNISNVLTYWGLVNIAGVDYVMLIVDNDDEYTQSEITQLAGIIEISMNIWQYSPDKNNNLEFVRALDRGDINIAKLIYKELDMDEYEILSVFDIKNLDRELFVKAVEKYEKEYGFKIISVQDEEDSLGIILGEMNEFANENCVAIYDDLKLLGDRVRIYQSTNLEGIEEAINAFALINETATLVGKVFPYKRVFSKYELTLVANCIQIQTQGGTLKTRYENMLKPFYRSISENKADALIETLETLILDTGMNGNMAAKFLNVHVNTIQYRLKKIDQILGSESLGTRGIPGLTLALALKRIEE